MFVYDFGKRRKTPCFDCDDRGHCTMNCSPPIKTDDALLTVIDVSQTVASTTAKPTCHLRWVPRSMMQAHDLKLQQAWEITHYEDSRSVRIETEWRDIPITADIKTGKET